MTRARPVDADIQGFFCPIPRPELVEHRLQSGKYIRSELGLEKLCAKCDSYWPIDTEYWFPSKTRDGLFGWCRACYMKQRWPNGRAQDQHSPTPIAMVAWGLLA